MLLIIVSYSRAGLRENAREEGVHLQKDA